MLIENWADKNHIDIVRLTETKVATSSTEGGVGQDVNGQLIRNKWKLFFSTGFCPKNVEKASTLKKQGKHVLQDVKTKLTEHIGVGVMVRNEWWDKIKDVRPISDRRMRVVLDTVPKIFINIVDAPHAMREETIRDCFYESTHREADSSRRTNLNIWAGDWNARPGRPQDRAEVTIIGDHAYTNPGAASEVQSEGVLDNRTRLIDFCEAHGLNIMNTKFQKPVLNKITFRPPGTKHGDNPSECRYEQIDLFLVADIYQNAVDDVYSNGRENLDTDHCPVVMKVSTKFRKQRNKTDSANAKYSCTQRKVDKKLMNEFFHDNLTAEEEDNYATWLRVHGEYVSATHKVEIEPRESYIRASTLRLIEDRSRRSCEISDEEKK